MHGHTTEEDQATKQEPPVALAGRGSDCGRCGFKFGICKTFDRNPEELIINLPLMIALIFHNGISHFYSGSSNKPTEVKEYLRQKGLGTGETLPEKFPRVTCCLSKSL